MIASRRLLLVLVASLALHLFVIVPLLAVALREGRAAGGSPADFQPMRVRIASASRLTVSSLPKGSGARRRGAATHTAPASPSHRNAAGPHRGHVQRTRRQVAHPPIARPRHAMKPRRLVETPRIAPDIPVASQIAKAPSSAKSKQVKRKSVLAAPELSTSASHTMKTSAAGEARYAMKPAPASSRTRDDIRAPSDTTRSTGRAILPDLGGTRAYSVPAPSTNRTGAAGDSSSSPSRGTTGYNDRTNTGGLNDDTEQARREQEQHDREAAEREAKLRAEQDDAAQQDAAQQDAAQQDAAQQDAAQQDAAQQDAARRQREKDEQDRENERKERERKENERKERERQDSDARERERREREAAQPPEPTGPTRDAEVISDPHPEMSEDLLDDVSRRSVTVRFRISSSGTASASLVRSSGSSVVDERVLAACNRWRFRPALRNGEPCSSTLRVRVDF